MTGNGRNGNVTAGFPRGANRTARWKASFANLSMQSKMIVIFVFLISLPILMVGYVSYRNYSHASQGLTTDYVAYIAANNLNRLDDYVTDLFNMSAMPLYMSSRQSNEDFMKYLGSPLMSVDKSYFMDRYLLYLNKIKPDTVSVYAFDNYDNVFYNVKSHSKRSDLNDMRQKWAKAAAAGDGSPRLISTQGVPVGELTAGNYAYYAFTVVRQLKDLDSRLPVGFIAFDTRLGGIERWMADMDKLTKGKTTLVDENGYIVYDSDQKLIARELGEVIDLSGARGQRGTVSINWNGVDYIVMYDTSALTGWKMYVYVPIAEITRQAAAIRNFTNASTLTIIAFALFISIVLTYALTRPLRKLRQLMREVQRGNLGVRFQVKYSDEIGSLGTHFNIMLVRIERLIEEVKWTQERKREAELQSLQHQINPHFIYNTLEMIRMTAEAKDDEEIGDMIFVLGKLLRYGIEQGNALVTIGDELGHLNRYLELQNLRFSNRFVLETDISDRLLQYRCIKLLFQPLVENAIHHAFKSKRGPGTIRISAEIAFEDLLLRVADDGSGMSPEAVKRLNVKLSGGGGEQNGSGRGIGIGNVNDRIKLHYGAAYGLSVSSAEGGGTVVLIRLPVKDEAPGIGTVEERARHAETGGDGHDAARGDR
ncbi:cache domain-containing sensor histidine kinase [Paenibacillus cymbidii]|uniref:cache domain-containing sensor histidine kinase n=1 Tax=Paenibacillus cymbidii TaxID=1639034 RepID=UPI001080FF91|nr:sensor histidine kinase [Paenibacillus cymbidii]